VRAILPFIKDWVLNIVALVLFIVLIEMLVPSGRMKKYVGLVTGFILIIAIINPFIGLIGSKVNILDSLTTNSGFLDRAEIKKDSNLLKEDQMKQIVEVYRKKIIERLEQTALDTEGVTGAKADVIINEDYNADNFGEIKRAYLEIEVEGKKEEIKPVAKVDKIKVGDEIQAAETGEKPDPAVVKRLEDRVSGLYGVERDNIVISALKE
jgi:stage III sporulation protein AF